MSRARIQANLGRREFGRRTVPIQVFSAFAKLRDSLVPQILGMARRKAPCGGQTQSHVLWAWIFTNGLGIKLGRKSYTDLMMSFKVSEEEGRKHEDNFYFNTSQPYGEKKLAAIIEESSFWSKHLFQKSATRYWIWFGIALTISIVGLLLIPLLNIGNFNLLISQVFCLVLTWMIAGNLFTTSLAFTEAARSSDNIESRLASMAAAGESDEDIFIIVSDYNALVGISPTIPSSIYQKNRDRLNLLWAERKRLIEKDI